MTRSLTGKVALVTDATKGIGTGIAKAMACAGASVVVNFATDRPDAERLVADIKAGGGETPSGSPLNVPGLSLDLDRSDVLELIRASRRPVR